MSAGARPPSAARPVAADPLLGTIIADRYHVLRVLGEGGMGVVYEAEQQFLGRTVAVKTLHGVFARKPEIVARFQNEAFAAAKVRNPHIVELLELGHLDDGALFIAMERLEGQELSKLVRDGPLPIGRVVRIALQLCDALMDVHAAGIVHRDLKPANIFLVRVGTNEDFVKILDFGISKIVEADAGQDVTRTRAVLGTPHYMAPEQIGNARSADGRADLYALGGILYRALTGRTPFIEKDFTELAIQVKTLAPPDIRTLRPDLPGPLAEVIHACLAKLPEQRPPDARTVRESLEPFASFDAPPRLSAPVTPAGAHLFAGAPPGSQVGGPLVRTVALAMPSQVGSQPVVNPGSVAGSVAVPSPDNRLMLLVSALATVLALGALAIAAYVAIHPRPTAVAPTAAAVSVRSVRPQSVGPLVSSPAPAPPTLVVRQAITASTNTSDAAVPVASPVRSASRTRRHRHDDEGPASPQPTAPTPTAPAPAASAPSAPAVQSPPPRQGVFVHGPIGSPF